MTADARAKTLPISESVLLAEIRKALGKEPDLVLWRLSQGGAVSRAGHTYRAGLSVNGAADLVGILTWPGLFVEYSDRDERICPAIGRFFALEVKTARGRQQDDQVLWGNLVRQRGGFYAVVRSVADAIEALKRARRGEDR